MNDGTIVLDMVLWRNGVLKFAFEKVGSTEVAFKGQLFVEDEEFELNAERLSVRDSEASFNFFGTDDSGRFWIEGVSERRSVGYYESDRLPVNYDDYVTSGEAVLRFSRIEKILHMCLVVGEWRQDGGRWNFAGLLEPFAG